MAKDNIFRGKGTITVSKVVQMVLNPPVSVQINENGADVAAP
jgi:hypothetical protein